MVVVVFVMIVFHREHLVVPQISAPAAPATTDTVLIILPTGKVAATDIMIAQTGLNVPTEPVDSITPTVAVVMVIMTASITTATAVCAILTLTSKTEGSATMAETVPAVGVMVLTAKELIQTDQVAVVRMTVVALHAKMEFATLITAIRKL